MNVKEVVRYSCGRCGMTYNSPYDAERCCSRLCRRCGKILGLKWIHDLCLDCKKEDSWKKCRKMTIEEYKKEFPNYAVVTYDNYYYSDIDSFLNNLKDISEYEDGYIFGTRRSKAKISYFDGIRMADEDDEFSYRSEYVVENEDGLRKLIEEWENKNHIYYYIKTEIAIDVKDYIKKQKEQMNVNPN